MIMQRLVTKTSRNVVALRAPLASGVNHESQRSTSSIINGAKPSVACTSVIQTNFLSSDRCNNGLQNMRYATDIKSRKDRDRTQDLATIDSFGAWDNNFELPLQMEASIQHGKPIPRITAADVGCKSSQGKRIYQEDRIQHGKPISIQHGKPIPCITSADVGYKSTKGNRMYQEDRFIIKDISENLLCCAVFDGHGGSECSSFCADNIESVLRSNLKKTSDLENLLHKSILELHSLYGKWVVENGKGEKSGTTCTICLFKEGVDLVVGHVGDSRALLCRRGGPRRLTNDHCPSNITERKRVEQSGGTVITDNIGRHMVNGILSMSRSIGDLHLKPYGVTALPDHRTMKIKHSNDSFLLLTTDGINYVLNDDEICKVVNHAPDPQSAAAALTEQAMSMSSEDNLTALVVPLGSWGKFAKSAASMFYSFGIGRDMTKSSRFG